jgi:hypothetical protein
VSGAVDVSLPPIRTCSVRRDQFTFIQVMFIDMFGVGESGG